MSKQTLIDELTKEVNQAKSTYQECDDDLSKRIFETKIRAYSHALDLANYHIHDGKESVDINHIESVVMNVINDFTTFIKPSREANAFVFDMLKKSIRLALQEYNLNGGWISVDDMLPPLFESVLTLSSVNTYQILALQEQDFFDFARHERVNISYITHWQHLPQLPKE